MNLKQKTIVCCEHGHQIYLAEKFSESFGKTFLYIPNEESYLTPAKETIGQGIPGIILIDQDIEFWKLVENTDPNDIVFFFPDVGMGALQHHLQWMKRRVCGSLGSGEIEMDRMLLNGELKKLGLPTAPMARVIGTTNLRAFLKEHPDRVIKVSFYRGVIETFTNENPYRTELRLIELDFQLGMNKDTFEFCCQEKIESELEVGFDGFSLNGKGPAYSALGIEVKDKAYVGAILEKMPPLIEFVNRKMEPLFSRYGYQGFYSNELRITDEPFRKDFKGKPFYTDCTARAPSPPSEAQCEIYEPHCLARAVWDLSGGEMPVLKPITKWFAEVVLATPAYDRQWLHVSFPDKIKQWVKVKDHCIKDGQIFCIPNHNGNYFANVVALGDTPQEAMDTVLKRAALVEAEDLELHTDIFSSAMKQLKLMKSYGLL